MNKRQTLYKPEVEWLKNALVEQKGEQNLYRLTWRNTSGELLNLLWTAEEINDFAKHEIIHLSVQEKMDLKTEKWAKEIERTFLNLKKEKPLNKSIDIYQSLEWRKAINDLLEWVSENDAQVLFNNNLKAKLWELWLKFFNFSYYYLKNKIHNATFVVSFEWNDDVREKELNERAEKCARILEEVYHKLKNENPIRKNIDVYGDKDWRKAITDLVDWASGSDAQILFDRKLEKELTKRWLTFSRPAYDYFVNKERSWSVHFHVSLKGVDILREDAVQKNVEKCAETIKEIFLKLKEVSPSTYEIDIYKDSKWQEAITSLVESTFEEDTTEIFNKKLRNELTKLWLTFNSTPYVYFIDEDSRSKLSFKVSELKK